MTEATPISAFTRLYTADDLGEVPIELRLEASETERAALAREINLPGISSLVAELKLARQGAESVRVTGRVRARPTRICVVSLEPFDERIEEAVDLTFAPPEAVAAAEARYAEASEEEAEEMQDPPDAIVGGKIDLGALTKEFLVLGLDPYPRKPGVRFEPPADAADAAPESPFAALARLKGEAPKGE